MILNYIHRQKITFDTFTQYLMQYFNTTSLFSLHYMHHFLMFNKLNLLQITMCKKKSWLILDPFYLFYFVKFDAHFILKKHFIYLYSFVFTIFFLSFFLVWLFLNNDNNLKLESSLYFFSFYNKVSEQHLILR